MHRTLMGQSASITQRLSAIKMHPRHVACLVILMAHVILTLIYSFTTPLWDSFDETGHYAYARYIAIHHALPPVGVKLSATTDESHQPPLYYILAAIPMSFVDTSDDAQAKFTAGGNTFVVVNAQLDSFPYRGTALALRLGRMVSVVLSAIAVAVTYAIVRTAFPARPGMAVLAMALHAFWPLFLFLGGMMSNDVGISLAGSLTTLFVVRLWVKPVNASRRWDYLGLMISAICGVLTKDNGLALVLFAGIVITGLTLRDLKTHHYRKLAELLYFIVPFCVLFLLGGLLSDGRVFRQVTKAIAIGATLVQSIVIDNGQTLAQRVLVAFSPYIARLPGWVSITLASLLTSYSWGFLNVPAQWLQPAAMAGIIAVVGLFFGFVQKQTRRIILLMLLCVICASIASLVAGTSAYYHARVILSSLSAIVVLITIGLLSLPRLIRRASAGYALVVVQMVALMSPVLVMAPAYQKPPLLDPVAMPAGMQFPSTLTFGDSIRLLGYSYPHAQTERGQDAAITLYWRALRSMPKDYAIKLELFSVSGESFQVQSQATPGNNNFPTSFWKPGDTFAETYRLPVKLDAPAPTLASFRITFFAQQTNEVMWYRPETQDILQPTCDNGVKCEPKVGALPVRLDSAAAKQWSGKPALYRLGQHIEMIDYHVPVTATAGQTITVSVVWRADATHPGDLTTFMHLFSSDGKLVAQVDSPPLHAEYPTSVWGTGEVIPDNYTLALTSTLPAGTYQLKMGMYDSGTHDRLPASDAAGAALVDSVIPLQEITVSR
jgi:hypothetical protein